MRKLSLIFLGLILAVVMLGIVSAEGYCKNGNNTQCYVNICKKNACTNLTVDEQNKIVDWATCEYPQLNAENCLCVGFECRYVDCIDGDGGKNVYIESSISEFVNGKYIEKGKDKCISDSILKEYFCANGLEGPIISEEIKCPQGYICKVNDDESGTSGKCVLETNFTCKDSDGGIDYYVKGNVLSGSFNATDYCGSEFIKLMKEKGATQEAIEETRKQLTFNDDTLFEFSCYSKAGEEICKIGKPCIPIEYNCPNGCRDGACLKKIKITPNETSGPISIPEADKSDILCDGCSLDNKCYPMGYRKGGKFCSDSGGFIPQIKGGEACDNNFECSSNVCVSGKCVSSSLIDKIISWFKSLFGVE